MPSSRRPVLFLDFDGVLLDQARCEEVFDAFGPTFDTEKVAFIAALQRETRCRIVVISSWRNRAEGGLPAMQRLVAERNLPFTIDDTVLLRNDPRQAITANNRSREIDLWLEEQLPGTIGPIAILDDAMRNGFFMPHHHAVHVQPFWSGMTETDYRLARDLLLHGPNLALVNRPAPSRPSAPSP